MQITVPGEEEPLATDTGCGLTGWGAALQKKAPGALTDNELNMSQQSPGSREVLTGAEPVDQGKGFSSSTQHTSDSVSNITSSFELPVSHKHQLAGQSSVQGHHGGLMLEHLTHKDRLREPGLFSLEKTSSGGLSNGALSHTARYIALISMLGI